MKKYTRPQIKIKCSVCGIMFQAERSKAINGTRKCCSMSCRGRKAASCQEKTGRSPVHGGCAGGVLSPLYRRWSGIKARCHSTANAKYGTYGARGIAMCTEWRESFSEFRNWAMENGFKPNLQIDRIDNNKGYCPSNCRWVTQLQNQANRRRSIIFPSGETTAEVAKRLGMSPNSIRERLRRGMTKTQAMTIKPVPNGYARTSFNLNLWNDSK